MGALPGPDPGQGPALEHQGPLQEQGIPLVRPLSELGFSPLKGELEGAKRRFVAIDEDRFHVPPIDGRVGLEEELQVEVRGEELVRPHHVDPCGGIIGIRVQDQVLEFVLQGGL